MKTNLLFFTLLLIAITSIDASNNLHQNHTNNNCPKAANGSYRMPLNKNFGKQRIEFCNTSSKSDDSNQKT
ncbi:hypothetical protein KBB68_01925 [Candidatus Babeliales bacterium]|nr:hypothetical protein [Candidatus Babeliales bacterium]